MLLVSSTANSASLPRWCHSHPNIIVAEISHTCLTYNIYKRVLENVFILFRSWVIDKPGFCECEKTWSFIFWLITQDINKTSKFDWIPVNIRTEKISRFLEQDGPHFEFDSGSFNYYMPKERSSRASRIRNLGTRFLCT